MLSFRLVNAFALCTFCRRCDICSCEELMSYAVLPSLWALHIIWSALVWWTIFLGGFTESPKFVTGTVVGDVIVYHLA